jgi:hypothetical protein
MDNGSCCFWLHCGAAFSAVDGVNSFDGTPSVENIVYWIKENPRY